MPLARRFLSLAALLIGGAARASLGLVELPANAVSGPVTVFYPGAATERRVQREGFEFEAAPDAAPAVRTARLVVISHGSPGTPWVHLDLVRALVAAGLVVALPEHQGDNARDDSEPGPPAWRRRPLEVSRAIDRLAQEPAWAPRLDLSAVGMFGMSAGGHTALTLAGGRWSPSRLREHCRAHLAEDFQACAGPALSLTGGLLDGAKQWIVGAVNDVKFADTAWYGHVDPRITAIVAAVPFAADFDPASLASPPVALALMGARQDRWLRPAFHGDRVAAACTGCVRLLDLPTGGHGAYLGPLPPPGRVSELVRDPPGFDRDTEVPRINAAITRFFLGTLPPAQPR